MNDFLAFRRMITPIIIQVLFWVGVAACIIAGIRTVIAGSDLGENGRPLVYVGLGTLLIGPVLCRVWSELLIVVFSIHDNLTSVLNTLRDSQKHQD